MNATLVGIILKTLVLPPSYFAGLSFIFYDIPSCGCLIDESCYFFISNRNIIKKAPKKRNLDTQEEYKRYA
jgi:hypothetical protein